MDDKKVESFGKGALEDRFDSRDRNWEEVGAGIPAFQWEDGFDVIKRLQTRLNNPQFKVPIKNQGTSLSCGGQAESYYGQILEAFDTGTFEERSAKFIYSQTFIPGQGSSMRDNAEIATKQGWGKEQLTPSYQLNMFPTEAFMQRAGDISDFARIDARSALSRSYAYVNPDINSVAQAASANNGAIMLIKGRNNGTWLSENPVPGNAEWSHFMDISGAFLRNGVKKLSAFQSWGEEVGDAGIQHFGKEWFDQNLIIRILTHVFNPSPIMSFHYNFTKNMEFGQQNDEIAALQCALQYLGFFPKEVGCSGKYLDITRRAVLDFQVKYKVDSPESLARLNGKNFGPKSRQMINLLVV